MRGVLRMTADQFPLREGVEEKLKPFRARLRQRRRLQTLDVIAAGWKEWLSRSRIYSDRPEGMRMTKRACTDWRW